MAVVNQFDGENWVCSIPVFCLGSAKAPAYTPPPTPPPAAAPATLASASTVATETKQNSLSQAEIAEFGTAGEAQGVAPTSVGTAKATLGGVS